VSPARSTTSLERYLAAPLTEEAIPSTAIDLLKDNYSLILRTGTTEQLIAELKRTSKLEARTPSTAKMTQSELEALRQYNSRTLKDVRSRARMSRALPSTNDVAGSIAGSDSSIDSGSSAGSWISQTSVDSRGPRRGRKSWVQVPNQFNATASARETEEKSPITTKCPKSRSWYCTWSSCNKSFQFRSEWDRHETAVHYWPYHWVCNLGVQPSAVHKDAASRIFYREDQLLIHMRDRHRRGNVTKHLVSTLKQGNPDFNSESLRCGFCYQVLRDWEERQDHVAAHLLKEGLAKSQWMRWEDRMTTE